MTFVRGFLSQSSILIQPKDVIILQETPGEALTRYLSAVIALDFFATILTERDATATTAIGVP